MGLLSLIAKLGLNASGYEVGLKRVESMTHQVGHSIEHELKSKIGAAFGAVAIEEAARRTVEFAEKINTASIRTGIARDTLQKWDFAALHASTSLEEIINSVEKLGIAQAKAINDPEMFATLKRLGLSDDQIQNLQAVPENFTIIGDRIKDAQLNGQLLNDVTVAFGKSAREIIPLFKSDLTEAGKELERMGGLISDEKLLKLVEASERTKNIWVQMRPGMIEVFELTSKWLNGLITGVKATITTLQVGLITAISQGSLSAGIEAGKGTYNDALDEFQANNKAGKVALDAEAARKLQAANYAAEAKKNSELVKTESIIERIKRTHEEIEEIQRKTAEIGLNDVDKRAAKEKHIADLKAGVSAAEGVRANDLETFSLDADPGERKKVIAQHELDVEEKKKKLAEAQQELAQFNFKSIEHTPMQFDSLTRIGGLGVNADNTPRLLTPLERIAKAAEETARNTEGSGGPAL